MATSTTSTQRRARPSAADAQSPAVVNVRRPEFAHAEIVLEPDRTATSPSRLDDAPPPQTMLRLPDLEAIVRTLPRARGKLGIGSIAQWVAIGLGGALALWLIFGGRAPRREIEEEAPAWNAPEAAAPESAPPKRNSPDWSADAPPAAPPAADAQSTAPQWNAPSERAEPEFDPYRQLQPGDEPATAEGPNFGDSAQGAAANPAVPRAPVHTAQRPDAAGLDRFQPSEAQPLDTTVVVPQ